MKIGIIGWYGTDTLGDRSILDGIFEILKELDEECTIYLGSLFCFYSNRSLMEERDLFSKTAPAFNIEIFDLKDRVSVSNHIKIMDAVIMGGGPLMDIEELFLIERCFDIAQKLNIPRIIMGCGVGPLENRDYRNSVKNILRKATSIYLRDELSVEYVKNTIKIDQPMYYVGDPAIVSIEKYLESSKNYDEKIISINLREYPRDAYSAKSIVTDDNFAELVSMCADRFSEVQLVPMHTFFIGGDDREYLSKIKNISRKSNVSVKHKPLSLEELYRVFCSSFACVGMRYHSIVMQTILNGNNIILNYTNEQKGKISGFIKSLETPYYDDRIINLQSISEWKIDTIVDRLLLGDRFNYKKSSIKGKYVNYLTNDIGR